MTRSLTKAVVAAACLLAAGGASAQQCVGFTDVFASDPFCPNVEWLRNRAITLGCNATEYCPTNAVSRLAMAAFMNRLGRALTPEVLHRQVSFGAVVVPGEAPDPLLLRCGTDDTPASVYPRQAVVNATLTGLSDGNEVQFRTFLVVSTDSGTTFQLLDLVNSVAPRATAGTNDWGGAAMTEYVALQPNTVYRFAIGVRRDNVAAGSTGNFATGRCQLTATIFNRNGTLSPF